MNLDELSDRQDQLNEKLAFFEMPQIFRPEIKKIKIQLDLLQEIWNLVGEWEKLWANYANLQIRRINNENLEMEVTQLSKKINKSFELYKDRNWEILGATKEQVDILKKTLPLIQDLCNPMLVQRHWDSIRNLSNSDFDEKSEDFTLAAIIELNLQKFTDDIRDISNASVMETQVETNIHMIINTWLDMRVDVANYRDMQYKIQNVDDCFQVIFRNFQIFYLKFSLLKFCT
jgi:dynein heavy chain